MEMTPSEWFGAIGQVLLVVVLSFVVLCALTSLIRFQLMTEQATEAEELGSSEERDFRVVVMNQIAAARKSRRPISVVLLQLPGEEAVREAETLIRPLLRNKDVVLDCGENRIGMMLTCGSERVDVPVRRILDKARTAGLPGVEQWRFGVAGYPEHGHKTSEVFNRAVTMLADAAGTESGIAGMADRMDVEDEAGAPRASIDPLTGLISEEKMLGIMRRYIAQERRKDEPVSVIYMEIDQHKGLIDRHGRSAFDDMLRELGTYLDAHIRETDIIARFETAGFVMTLNAKPDAAVLVAQRIIEEVRRTAFTHAIKVSMNAGVAGYPDVMGTVVQYFVSAEAALQTARSRGRNQCVKFDHHLQAKMEDEHKIEQI